MFQTKRFDNFIKLNRGFDLPDDKIISGKYPVVASTSVKAYHNEFKVKAPAVVTGRSGSLGKIQFIDNDCWPLNTTLYVKDFKGNNPKYVYYLLQTMHLEQYNAGAGVPTLNQNHLHSIKLKIHSLPTQERIADILSTYDDLIENNNKRIALLEKAAQELYKEWFVRFRFPGHETARFINGLPEGWEVKRMNDFCYVTDGTHDTPKPVDNGVPLITGRCIKNGYVDFNAAYSISFEDHEKIKKRSGLKTGDILLSNIGTVGNTCRVIYDREFSVKNVIIFKPDSDLISHYLYYLLISQSAQDIFAAQTNGASQQFVGLTFMRRFKILVPSDDVLTAFSKKVESLLKHKDNLFAQNQNLAKQRDLLLPRLMSGKLEV
jgi:type I restriction enzyme S subunit